MKCGARCDGGWHAPGCPQADHGHTVVNPDNARFAMRVTEKRQIRLILRDLGLEALEPHIAFTGISDDELRRLRFTLDALSAERAVWLTRGRGARR